MFTKEERELLRKLERIDKRVDWIANEEARSVWVRGVAARGKYIEEKNRLIEKIEQILDELQKLD